MENVVTVSTAKLPSALSAVILARQPAMIHGDPGIGKSDVVRQTVAALNRDILDIRASLTDPVDWRGIPTIKNDVTTWSRPDFLPVDGTGVLFLDEINRAPIMVQNALFQLILDRRLGDYRLPDGWAIVSAVNDNDTGVQKIGSALGNRFVHLYAKVDVDSWCNWAVDSGIDPMVRAFIRYRPDLLHMFTRDSAAYPTPRSWSFVASILPHCTDTDILRAMVAGSVGYPSAIEFLAFRDLYSRLPNMDAIVLNPDTADIPTDSATLYAVSSALSNRATPANFDRIMVYVNRLPAEYGVFTVKDASRRHPEIAATAGFTNWAIKHSNLI